ncbi:hypothetical protein QEN58_03620 [Halomonas alkaliantarctica]|uniref:Uncharacterized protein n=1 Tax=Halomonas alkaliantarctica TaxID=232346 RepID=A0ABY8LP39_9GAMM|nr:hypothetical protein [Halomonas alkaliantarctica]WGI26156.1 hypothetical protein QEN58_03620 [Halomonas alkaliantarctica]
MPPTLSLTHNGKEEAMTQVPGDDKKAPKEKDDHHDEANPMPDTHHVNPESDDDKKSGKGSKK